MSSIFNSLGSNYSKHFVLKALRNCTFSSFKSIDALEKKLEIIFQGTAIGVYKGRDAIEIALRVLLPKESKVFTQAFSCYAVEEGIVRAGMQPVYTDTAENTTNMSLDTLRMAFKKNPQGKAVLVQHSLGIPAEIIQIKKWCEKNNILLIEDLAQGFGGINTSGEQLGKNADVVICSFGRDKIIDAVSGGAVIFKKLTQTQSQRVFEIKKELKTVPVKIVISEMIYPLITTIIRRTHHMGIGKIIFFISKKIGLLGSPIISRVSQSARIHPAYADLALYSLDTVETQLIHRKHIAKIYLAELSEIKDLQMIVDVELVNHASNLRFSFLTKNAQKVQEIILKLKKDGVYIPDRWYREAVDCGSFACKTAYKKGSCKNAEDIAQRVVNLPTHREISPEIALQISGSIIELFR